MWSQQSSPSVIQSQSAHVLRIFLVSFSTTTTLEKTNTESIEARNTALLPVSAPASALLGSESEAEICGAMCLGKPLVLSL